MHAGLDSDSRCDENIFRVMTIEEGGGAGTARGEKVALAAQIPVIAWLLSLVRVGCSRLL